MARAWLAVIAAWAIACCPTTLLAAIAWDEEGHGDLSSNPNAPTSVTLEAGSNLVLASVLAPNDIYDYFTFTISQGQSLIHIYQLDFVDIPSGFPGNTAFHAIIEGETSYVPDFDTIDFFLGANHMDPLPPSTDVLPDLANATLGGSGFSLPLGPGTYTYHVQQVDVSHTGYSLDFVLEESAPSIGDFDGDDDVDGRDFLLWQRGQSHEPLSIEDLELWQDQYGTTITISAVPEPTSLISLLTMATLVLANRWGKKL